MNPIALILQAHGTNRDLDVAEALTLAGAAPVFAPLNELRAGKKRFSDYQMLVIPGGFSYADALGAGKLLALDLNSYFADEISAFVAAGKPVIGICNGFQALVKSGILPGNDVIARSVAPKQSPVKWEMSERGEIASSLKTAPRTPAPPALHQTQCGASVAGGARDDMATLTFNEQGHFECRWVNLQPISQTCIWTQGLDELITCPVSHGEGNFQTNHQLLLTNLTAADQIALTYTHPDGSPANGAYPSNPNGSILDIAGICNPAGNVLGLMPHPENHIHFWQHPRHTRGERGGSGLALFENGVKYAVRV